ncbi:MAG: asparagine synthase (glutamine-hydrolyzing) [Vicinamibacterales bacterium]
MCGIAGRVNFASGAPVDAGVVGAMCDLIAHRGPDGHGVHCDGMIGFGHRRLAIIDLSPLGRQPMQTDDGQVVITFNGEIYNFQELRDALEARGHRFRSHSDTEVILAAYREYGDACVEKLAGMFAFAIWDAPRRRLLIARDRLGKKPLHYRIDGDGIAFASEPKAFLADPGFEARVNPQAIADYLSLQYVPAPLSAFAGVQKLPPAHVLVVEDGRVDVRRYWRLSYARQQTAISDDDAIEAMIEQTRRAVRRRLVSDVPLGAFLSGGIDSGLVVSFMAECLDTPVRTFSIGFDDEAYNELPAARMVAEKYGTRHEEFVVRPRAADLLPQLVWHYGEPYADSSALPTYVLSELTRRHVTVALNGDAGDENFAGYDRYRAMVMANRLEAVPRSLRRTGAAVSAAIAAAVPNRTLRRGARFARRLADTPERRYAGWVLHFEPSLKRTLCTPEFLAATEEHGYSYLESAFAGSDATTWLERTLDVDVRTYLPEDLLVKVDIATMAHGLEGRSPFLDHDLMEFAASLPARFKLRGGEKKWLLRQLARRRLPPTLLTLPKKGFGVPIDRWFREDLRETLRDVLFDGRLAGRGYVRMDAVQRIYDEHVSGQALWHFQLWNLLMLELWHRMFIDERPTGAPARVPIADEAPAPVAG